MGSIPVQIVAATSVVQAVNERSRRPVPAARPETMVVITLTEATSSPAITSSRPMPVSAVAWRWPPPPGVPRPPSARNPTRVMPAPISQIQQPNAAARGNTRDPPHWRGTIVVARAIRPGSTPRRMRATRWADQNWNIPSAPSNTFADPRSSRSRPTSNPAIEPRSMSAPDPKPQTFERVVGSVEVTASSSAVGEESEAAAVSVVVIKASWSVSSFSALVQRSGRARTTRG